MNWASSPRSQMLVDVGRVEKNDVNEEGGTKKTTDEMDEAQSNPQLECQRDHGQFCNRQFV